MPLGIRPIVDFAFKKIFGTPANKQALISLIDAVLQPPTPITDVQILNPFNYKEFEESKEIALDVRCQDSSGRWLNVEMQVGAYAGMLQRLVYYAASMYASQLATGVQYIELSPAISICFLNHLLFRQGDQAHHRFRLTDTESGRVLEETIEVHTVELPKYNLEEETIRHAGRLEQWVFFLRNAQDYDGATLRRLLPGIEFDQAIKTIEIIAAKTEDRHMYDAREKAILDFKFAISGARREGLEEGMQQGMQKGLQKGRSEGKLAGTIQALQQVLGESVTPDEELLAMDLATLEAMVAELQQRIRSRGE